MNNKNKKGGILNGFDFVAGLNNVFPNTEFHLPGYNFAGPGTQLQNRLSNFEPGKGKYEDIITPPINKLDEAAMNHDLSYSKYKDLNNRHKADQILINTADEILNDINSSKSEIFDAGLVKLIMKGKIKLGIGLGGQISGNIDVNQLIKEAQQISQTNEFKGNTNYGKIIAPLLFLTASIGIPALLKLIRDKKKSGTGQYIYECYDISSDDVDI